MFFHIDESGNTGNNLFDAAQPRLSYGVLSSVRNVDALCTGLHKKIQYKIGQQQIHANHLGIGGLMTIAPELCEIQRKMQFDFDYYAIEKKDYALTLFFDSVFDAGLNEAVSWTTYWTPMRFVVIGKLALLFDEPLLKESWRLCTERRIENHASDIVELLSELKKRTLVSGLDQRSIEVIVDALNYGIKEPLALDFGYPDQKMVSPNAVGFQFVVSSIARRVRKKRRKKPSAIIVDRQHQFNNAQIGTHYNLVRIAQGMKNAPASEKAYFIEHPLFTTMDAADILYEGLTDRELTISRSVDSIGLQIVDVYLWLTNKIISGYDLPDELMFLWSTFIPRSAIDGISLSFMEKRFVSFEKQLPTVAQMTEEQRQFANLAIQRHREKVQGLNLNSETIDPYSE